MKGKQYLFLKKLLESTLGVLLGEHLGQVVEVKLPSFFTI